MLKPSRCKSCNAAIIWARTTNGKRIPVDADPSREGGNIELRNGTATVHGKAQLGLHKSHFATCPHADQHRGQGRLF